MRTVSRTRTVVIVGARPRSAAAAALRDVGPGEEAAIHILGLDPTAAQRRFAAEALAIASEQRFHLTAELIPAPSWLRERLHEDDEVRALVGRREARRWRIEPGPRLEGA
jgi:hypothetical protein